MEPFILPDRSGTPLVFSGGLAGDIFDFLVQIHVVLCHDPQEIADQGMVKLTAVVTGI